MSYLEEMVKMKSEAPTGEAALSASEAGSSNSLAGSNVAPSEKSTASIPLPSTTFEPVVSRPLRFSRPQPGAIILPTAGLTARIHRHKFLS